MPRRRVWKTDVDVTLTIEDDGVVVILFDSGDVMDELVVEPNGDHDTPHPAVVEMADKWDDEMGRP